jgi:hypothetical protein
MKRFIHIAAATGLAVAYLGTATLLLLASMFPVVPGPSHQAIESHDGQTKDVSINVYVERRHVPPVKTATDHAAIGADVDFPQNMSYPDIIRQACNSNLPASVLFSSSPSRAPPSSC